MTSVKKKLRQLGALERRTKEAAAWKELAEKEDDKFAAGKAKQAEAEVETLKNKLRLGGTY